MAADQGGSSFWNSLAGVLAAVGGLIGAVAALLTALVAVGWIPNPFTPPKDSPSKPPSSAATTDGSPATLEASPRSQSFGSVQVGRASSAMTITITNPGKESTGITASLDGDHTEDFSVIQDSCRESLIPAGNACQVYVEFHPHQQGDKTALLRIKADHAASPAPVTLTGTALPPGSVTFEPASIVILLTGPTPPAWPTVGTQQLRVTNNGPGTLLIQTISIDDPQKHFSIVSNNCLGKSLTVGASCVLTVQLKVSSTDTGIFRANAQVTDDATDSPQSIPLSGLRGLRGPFIIRPIPTP